MSASLKLDRLVKKFVGLLATDHVSLEIAPGESVGLIGPNGAGKTTIFSQVMGDLHPTDGDILLDDNSMLRLGVPGRVRRGIARTYQVPRPFAEMSVVDNIGIGLMPDSVWKLVTQYAPAGRAEEIAMSVGFSSDDLVRLPRELSGEIAMMSRLLQSLRKEGLTFLIVSHDLKALEPLVDRVLALDQGRVIASGKYTDVIANEQVRSSYLGSAA